MFYREVNFKGTEIGRIPKDWEVSKLEKICEKIKAGGTPLTTKKEFWNGDIPFVKIEDMTSSGKYLMKTSSFITKVGLENSNAWLVPENSLLLAMYGSLGEVSINTIDVATNQAILGIIPKEKDDVEFLYYWFLYFKPCWRRFAKPTTQANLTAEIVRNSTLPLPSPQERRKIVEILSTVDEAIQKTNEIIAKTERLKKGLMQELLTKGIGHKEFKDTEIGRIPRGWEVVKLGDVVTYRKGVKPKVVFDQREPNTLPYLTADDVRAGIFTKWAKESDKTIKVNKDDVILIWDGFYCGDAFMGLEGILSSTMIKIEPKSNLNGRFLFYILKTHFKELNTKISGMYLKHVNKSVFENLKLPLPPPQEQQKIVEILSTIDKKLDIEKNQKVKLKNIKQGLMDLLLTGKVRVKVI
jgi:type I restriction enzyme S subunit